MIGHAGFVGFYGVSGNVEGVKAVLAEAEKFVPRVSVAWYRVHEPS
jgi:hypothetical protein